MQPVLKMRYLITRWNLSPDWQPDWPDQCAVELDDSGWEARRVEIFGDGSLRWTDGVRGTAETYLASAMYSQDLSECADWEPVLLEKSEFDALWAKAVSQ
jgi:hypothetical protein